MQDSKICFKCNVEKPLNDFYKHPKMFDGYVNKCKECNKVDVKENRLNNIDYYREYDKGRMNKPERVLARLNYSNSEAGKESHRKARKAWIESNTIKRASQLIVKNAVKNGTLIKKNECEVCNASEVRIHGHHDDYAYPMTVRWLCPKCHFEWHKKNGSGING